MRRALAAVVFGLTATIAQAEDRPIAVIRPSTPLFSGPDQPHPIGVSPDGLRTVEVLDLLAMRARIRTAPADGLHGCAEDLWSPTGPIDLWVPRGALRVARMVGREGSRQGSRGAYRAVRPDDLNPTPSDETLACPPDPSASDPADPASAPDAPLALLDLDTGTAVWFADGTYLGIMRDGVRASPPPTAGDLECDWVAIEPDGGLALCAPGIRVPDTEVPDPAPPEPDPPEAAPPSEGRTDSILRARRTATPVRPPGLKARYPSGVECVMRIYVDVRGAPWMVLPDRCPQLAVGAVADAMWEFRWRPFHIYGTPSKVTTTIRFVFEP
jgi:hypothetical protein